MASGRVKSGTLSPTWMADSTTPDWASSWVLASMRSPISLGILDMNLFWNSLSSLARVAGATEMVMVVVFLQLILCFPDLLVVKFQRL